MRVGIIDTGIDASHPDLDDNVNRSLSRNFTTDIPLIDGPCEEEPDHSCSDPATVDEGGHHRALEIVRTSDRLAAEAHDQVLGPQAGTLGRTAGHDVDHLDATLDAELLLHARRQRPRASGDPDVRASHTASG